MTISINVNIFKKNIFILNIALKYPPFDVRLKKIAEKTYIFDGVRKKWLVLTPEEWVRQHVINYLIVFIKISTSSISLEKEFNLNGIKKRYDIVVFDKQLKPTIIIECKAPYVELNTEVLEQALRYNLIIKSKLLMITNGVSDLVFDKNNRITKLNPFLK
jgi:hypothetical protein